MSTNNLVPPLPLRSAVRPSGNGNSALRTSNVTSGLRRHAARLALLLAGHLGHERGYILRVRALDDVGWHVSLAEACLRRARGRRALQAPVLERVQYELRGRLERVQVGSHLTDRVSRGERMADGAMHAEQLSTGLLRGV